MSEKHYVGLDITGFSNNGKRRPISRVTLMVDDENAVTAGDDTGMELSADCPHATQAMVESILAAIKGYQYQAYNADAANIDPAAELGDGVNVGGVYSLISRIFDDGSGYQSISAPGEQELEEEFPSAGPMQREFSKQIATLSSQIIKTSEEITLKVEETDERVSELSTKIDSITLSVTNGKTSSTIKLMAGSTEISSQEIKLTGLVTFDDLSTEGKTTIHGGNIQTETLRVQDLYGSTVYLKTEEDSVAGIMSITGASTSDYAVELDSYGALRFLAQNGAVYLASYTEKAYSSYLQLGSFDISVGPSGAVFRPGADSAINLGSSSYYWANIYCKNSSIDLSDRNAKEEINYDMSRYDALFDRIRPCSYKFLDGDRTHWGVISQDFEQSLEACGFTSMDIAAFCKDMMPDGTERYAMRYTEFIPLLIWEVQNLKSELKKLKGDLQ